jgi:hypothetical protein
MKKTPGGLNFPGFGNTAMVLRAERIARSARMMLSDR